ncbi:MAG: hypothetical protein OHK0022_38940 [Roseiflexaceae bacterium]
MSDSPVSIATRYQGWGAYQERLVAALQPLSAEQLELRAAPHLSTVGMLAAHIILVRAGWFYFVLNEHDPRLGQFGAWNDPGHVIGSASELVAGLETTWAVIRDRLERWTAEDLAATFWDTDDQGNPEGPYSREWVLWHLLEHDLFHGGELSLTLGMHGLPGVKL